MCLKPDVRGADKTETPEIITHEPDVSFSGGHLGLCPIMVNWVTMATDKGRVFFFKLIANVQLLIRAASATVISKNEGKIPRSGRTQGSS